MFDRQLSSASEKIADAARKMGLPLTDRVEWNPTPFRGQWGFGTPVSFKMAAAEARAGKNVNVPERAGEIAEALVELVGAPPGFATATAENGYINLYFNAPDYAQTVVDTALDQGIGFGQGKPVGLRVMVEYSQPNTHKAFHVGHLRNVILGGAMANILEFAGWDTVRANYIGDIGWHVVQWLWGYLKFHADEEPQDDVMQWMQDIYAEASQLIEANPEYEGEARQLFGRWERRDPEIVDVWQRTRNWSLGAFDRVYALLGEDFDVYFYESEVEQDGKELVEELIEKGIAEDERPQGGPVVVKLDDVLGMEEETYRTLVILRSDGTSLYATKDLPLAIRKFEQWEVDYSIYVIDVRQSLYLRQIFKLLELLGYEQAQQCFHLSYEIVNLPGNVIVSSREGTIVLFDELIHEAVQRAAAIVEDKNPQLSSAQKDHVSEAVALGSLKYAMLSVDNNRVVTFEWDRALDFEGQAAPYIQYAHVRAGSILRNASGLPGSTRPAYELHNAEVALLDRLSRFPAEVQRAAQDYKPLIIANYAYDLARDFTEFYQSCRVLQAEAEQRSARLRLTAAARQTLENSLRLLGIQAPEMM